MLVTHLRGVVHDQAASPVPGDGRRVQLDGVVVVARRAVGRVDPSGAAGQRRLGIADLDGGRLAQDVVRIGCASALAAVEVE